MHHNHKNGVNGVEIEDVALGCELALEWPIEGAERTIFSAEIRVVDVAIDHISDHAFGV